MYYSNRTNPDAPLNHHKYKLLYSSFLPSRIRFIMQQQTLVQHRKSTNLSYEGLLEQDATNEIKSNQPTESSASTHTQLRSEQAPKHFLNFRSSQKQNARDVVRNHLLFHEHSYQSDHHVNSLLLYIAQSGRCTGCSLKARLCVLVEHMVRFQRRLPGEAVQHPLTPAGHTRRFCRISTRKR